MVIKLKIRTDDIGRDRMMKFATELHDRLEYEAKEVAHSHGVNIKETEIITPYALHTEYKEY